MATAMQVLVKRLMAERAANIVRQRAIYTPPAATAAPVAPATPAAPVAPAPEVTYDPRTPAPAPMFLSAPVAVKEMALANSGATPAVDSAGAATQAENRARFIQVGIAAAVLWLAFSFLDSKGR